MPCDEWVLDKYLRTVSNSPGLVYLCPQLLEASRFGHFVLRSLQNGSTGSKCRDCDTKQSFSSTAIAVTPACVSRPCALRSGDAGELLCPAPAGLHMCVFPQVERSVSHRKPIVGNWELCSIRFSMMITAALRRWSRRCLPALNKSQPWFGTAGANCSR